ncbi:hypothetical protein [Corallococcus sp. EGB]|uniref:hypothetical protein n=1 Tax=Corallococcus sp. EGB TaxID=1521117 RepID=UPI001CBE3143|nr:hypothetical protein [Corallococcus sp. EGB]
MRQSLRSLGRSLMGLLSLDPGCRTGDVAVLSLVLPPAKEEGLLASWLPARRASRVDPNTVLRSDV